MKLRCMQSPAVSSIPQSVPFPKPFSCGKAVFKLPASKKACLDARRLRFLDFGARSSGITTIRSQAQSATPSNGGQKDANLVFVAGATGKVGSRTVRELLKLGLNVRAGVRSTQRAEPLVQSVRNLKLEDVAGGTQPTDKLELVECDLENLDRIRPALGNSSIVICCIGASEKEVFDITGPYRIDYQATKNLIDAATSAKVEHFILVTSLGTNKVGFPAAILNLFWGVLIWKRKAEEALIASGLPYTIVRPGGMERPTDSYKETHNVTLSEEDTLFGGQVSNLQVAELLAFMAKNRSVSYCKVVEVIAETTAPLTPFGDLLKKIPSQRPDIYSVKEQDEADRSQPVVSDSSPVEEEPKPAEEEPKPAEEEPEQIKATRATPLSPYAAYEDLKPPTSPTPTASTGAGATKASKTEIVTAATSSTSSPVAASSLETSIDNVIPQTAPKKTHAYSPYINYEDLKPPSSPTPTPSGSKKEPSIAPTPTEVAPQLGGGNDVPTGGSIEATAVPTTSASPYIAYEELKPPTSPSPIAPTQPSNSEPEKPVEENPESHTEPKAKPLSPYTMYEEMKPPSTPTPSPK
ncbi:protein TIC 62, chloroplastic [Salvia miltiorrhiza]|uniref:protein TIC 62, chloroplastic n=1 Tax=Salvia miltiorrhiza TaxID=226208 RepID=UPI0025AC4707|nr:protein TIC 62, chloroplastic [Salvia miltiorrhiza]